MKNTIINVISGKMAELSELSRYLYDNPELGDEEFKATELLTGYFSKNGFTVEEAIYGLKTTFRAVYDSGKPGAHIALFCEYDALPQIGHGCGHNLISAMSAGAALGLKSVLDTTGGKVTVSGLRRKKPVESKAFSRRRELTMTSLWP
jgi:metal-dependent amidase/aminoacylase/carboxypeptidase family protein